MTAPRHGHVPETQSSGAGLSEADESRSDSDSSLDVRHGHLSETPSSASEAPATDADVNPDEANAVDVENPAGEPDPGAAEPGQDGARG
ncbi:MAG: hypothetical protein IR160_04070 [Salinibacterium sp.]|nr:hypothetical protein [Salinibacterium sp.]MBF0671743.1 hypothetical protein [Salinibacterium sp.]